MSTVTGEMKNPWLAAGLNLLPFGFGYFYLRQPGIFVRTIFFWIAMPFIGAVVGPVVIDGVLAGVPDCGRLGAGVVVEEGFENVRVEYFAAHAPAFSEECPRPTYAVIGLFGGWAFPAVLLAIFTAWGARRRAIAHNRLLESGPPVEDSPGMWTRARSLIPWRRSR